jgi:Fe2+ or Zn2+ uptake regulation protein
MRKIDKKTGEILDIKTIGLWAPLPIPAFQVLARQRNWKAQRLLTCLVSFLGSDGYCVYPSYDKISERSGLGRNSIRKALDALEENGFINIYYFREGKKERNKYYLQESCWDSGKMNKVAIQYRTPMFKCLDCGKLIDRGGYGEGLKANKVHWACGGPVVSLEFINQASAS